MPHMKHEFGFQSATDLDNYGNASAQAPETLRYELYDKKTGNLTRVNTDITKYFWIAHKVCKFSKCAMYNVNETAKSSFYSSNFNNLTVKFEFIIDTRSVRFDNSSRIGCQLPLSD